MQDKWKTKIRSEMRACRENTQLIVLKIFTTIKEATGKEIALGTSAPLMNDQGDLKKETLGHARGDTQLCSCKEVSMARGR